MSRLGFGRGGFATLWLWRYRVQDSGFRASRVQDSGFRASRVQDSGFRASRVQDSGFRV